MSKKSHLRPAPEGLGLPPCGIDSHAHLDLDPLAQDLDAYLAQAEAAGVACMGQVFLGPEAYLAGRERFADERRFFFLAGIHPNDAAKMDPEATAGAVERLGDAFRADPRLRAVGEIGLDYYWDFAPPERQEAVFRAQLNLARELDRPVVIHCRDAFEPCLAILKEEGWPGRPLLWHCFGGDEAMARSLLDLGWRISIPGPVTYRQNEDLRRAAAMIPLDRLCLETDCPYLAPEPWRGKTNHPALMAFTCAEVARAKGMDPAEVWRAAADTARAFFGLPGDCGKA